MRKTVTKMGIFASLGTVVSVTDLLPRSHIVIVGVFLNSVNYQSLAELYYILFV